MSSSEVAPSPASPFSADHPLHEFGDVAVDEGMQDDAFVLTNSGSTPTRIVAVSTSSESTTALLLFPDGSDEGPFGMQEEEIPSALNRTLEIGEAVTATVRFDPAAHGPDAVGPVE